MNTSCWQSLSWRSPHGCTFVFLAITPWLYMSHHIASCAVCVRNPKYERSSWTFKRSIHFTCQMYRLTCGDWTTSRLKNPHWMNSRLNKGHWWSVKFLCSPTIPSWCSLSMFGFGYLYLLCWGFGCALRACYRMLASSFRDEISEAIIDGTF